MNNEKKGIYTLVHGFSEEMTLAKHVSRIIKHCSDNKITGTPSKMGTHLTLIPPFYGEIETIIFAASLLKVLTALINEMTITTDGIGYFPPPTEDSNIEAMYLKIKLPKKYHEHVEWLKGTGSFEWVHPPAQTTAVEPIYIPHVHIIEGKNLKSRMKSTERTINVIASRKTFYLPPPKFFKKNEVTREWKQVIL